MKIFYEGFPLKSIPNITYERKPFGSLTNGFLNNTENKISYSFRSLQLTPVGLVYVFTKHS